MNNTGQVNRNAKKPGPLFDDRVGRAFLRLRRDAELRLALMRLELPTRTCVNDKNLRLFAVHTIHDEPRSRLV
jgi:hypothetical protein